MYCDMTILLYPKRGVYVGRDRTEQYQMLKVLLHTLCIDELNTILKMSRNSKVIYHDDEGVIEISVIDGKADAKDDTAVGSLFSKTKSLNGDFSYELAVVPHDAYRQTTYDKSKNVINPLMRIKPIIEVSL